MLDMTGRVDADKKYMEEGELAGRKRRAEMVGTHQLRFLFEARRSTYSSSNYLPLYFSISPYTLTC